MHQHGSLEPAAIAQEFGAPQTGQRVGSTALSLMRVECTRARMKAR
jgi:hypothetical protein